MLEINFRGDIKKLQKGLSNLAYEQLPFATAQALTNVAKRVSEEEKKSMQFVLDRPTPFTVNSVGVKAARKDTDAIVYVKDIAATYLEPYQFSGRSKGLGARDVFMSPVDIGLNQYGNIPKAKLAQLKARSDVFIGVVKTKSGERINGVWQRVADSATVTRVTNQGWLGFFRKTQTKGTRAGLNKAGHMKLLIRFEDPHPVKATLDWFGVAERTARRSFNVEMGKALAKAIATAK